MILTVILLVITSFVLALYALTGLRLTKRALQIDSTLVNLISQSDGADVRTDAAASAELTDAYNARADLDEEIAEFHDCIAKLGAIVAAVSIITLIAAFL